MEPTPKFMAINTDEIEWQGRKADPGLPPGLGRQGAARSARPTAGISAGGENQTEPLEARKMKIIPAKSKK